MRVTISGSYGTGNRGDDVILAQLLQLLLDHLGEAEFTIFCRDEKRLGLFLDREFPDTARLMHPLNTSFRRRPGPLLDACLHSDLFILGGGGLLWGRAPGNLSYWLLRPLLAEKRGAKLAFYLPGIYGIKDRTSARLLAHAARRADFLSVRDQEGYDQLLQAGVPASSIILGADPAFLLPPPPPSLVTHLVSALGLEGSHLIGVSARDWRRRLSAGIFARMVRNLLKDERVTLLFFAMKTGGLLGETDTDDMKVASQLLRTLPEELRQRVLVVDENYSIDEMLGLMAASRYLIGMRLHALIFATIAGTPFGAVAYDEKVAAYMRMLGREDRMLSLKELADSQHLVALTQRLEKERIDSGIQGPLPQILQQAVLHADRAQDAHRRFIEALVSWFPREAS